MAAIHWANAVDGSFAIGTYWTGDVAPGSGDDAILDAVGVTPYTVSGASGTVASIQTAANATLEASGLKVTGGTGAGVNAGVIDALGQINLAGSLVNSGSVLLGGDYNYIGATTFGGGGDIELSDQAGYRIHGTGLITNIDNTISGAGTISVHLTNEAKGVIDATGANNRLVFTNFGGAIVNYGLIESTGAAGMLMDNVTEVTNFGTIAADGSGALTLFQCAITNYGEILVTKGSTLVDYGIGDIVDGTIQVDAGGSFVCDGVTGGDGAFVNNVAFNNAGLISIPSYNFLDIGGTITNTGTVALNASGHQSRILIETGLTLAGAGQVTLSDDSENLISGHTSAATFTNLGNTITGAGTIGDGAMTIVNGARGVIDATGTNNVLALAVGPTFSNAGVIEATGAAGMLITGGTVANAGKIEANGAGALTLQQTTIVNGAGGQVRIAAGAAAELASAGIDGGVLSGAGTLELGAASGGGPDTLGPGLRLTVAKIALADAGASVDVTEDLAYAGQWSQTAGALSVAGGDKIRFAGAGDAFAGTLTGTGTIAFGGGSDLLAGATVSAARSYISGAAVTFSGTITLTNTLTAATPNLVVAAGGATLTGGGVLNLTDSATSAIIGAATTATLTNGDRIWGAGNLGGGSMTLVNAAGGTIDGDNTVALIIDTGANTIANAGRIENTGGGGTTLKSALANTGMLYVARGVLAAEGAVTGTGRVWISGGTADFAAAFSHNVLFTPGSTGTLELANSQAYAGAITGLSLTGATALDLADIGFVSSGEATFVENKAGTAGVLTVTDGTHTARITLRGDYSGSAFVASSDGHGGTKVVDPAAGGGASMVANARPFIAAMAGMAASHAAASPGAEFWPPRAPSVALPRAWIA